MGDARQSDLIRTLTITGALVHAAWILWLFDVVQRATRIGASRFGNVWEEKIEALVFITLPPSASVLALAATALCVATWLAGPTQELPLAILLRLVRWSANAMVVVAALSVVTVVVGEAPGPDRLGTVAFRIAGVLVHLAISVTCRGIGRTAPGG
ncbi:hypothetical protein [Ilumatobacter sp.]|uniref:hypothetical protein n=1 Tax=Ilumatobacter sp. TaxID=1967498 RepID=UPI003B520366